MSLQLVRIVLFLPFISTVSAGTPPLTRSLSFSVIQTPRFWNVSEGSDVTLNCNLEGNVSSKWFINWMKMGKNHKIKNSAWISVITNNKSSTLILKSTVTADSGTYNCIAGYSEESQSGNTSVIIREKPNLEVSQTPQNVSRKAGGNVTITCNFTRVDNRSLVEVKWYKGGQEVRNRDSDKFKQKVHLKLVNVKVEDSGNYVCMIKIRNRTGSGNGTWVDIPAAKLLVIQSPLSIQRTEGENLTMNCRVQGQETKHLHNVSWYKIALDGQKTLITHGADVLKDRASLFLRNIKKEDSGDYICEVDRYGQGKGTRVKILGRKKPTQDVKVKGEGRQPGSPQENTGGGIGIPVGVGVAVGTLIFLLLLGIVVWRSKRKNKGASENPSEIEPGASKEARKHTPLAKQESDVTYADIRFHKREVQPDAEVVYAEVRLGAQRPENRGRGTQPAGLH